jgi:hypothetical protein
VEPELREGLAEHVLEEDVDDVEEMRRQRTMDEVETVVDGLLVVFHRASGRLVAESMMVEDVEQTRC